jgi:leucine-rich repeat-containing G protein-coupled receptor 7/leucine-rich repeat-containing G protein-coupled receptor 8
MFGVHAYLSDTTGFPVIVQEFDHLVVNLSYCNLTVQPLSYQKTVTLDLSHNRLTYWHILSFIQFLHLQHNLIEAVNFTSNLRHSEARLQYLDLSSNQISIIEKDDFIGLPNLLYLKIRNNRLIEIHEKALSFVPKLFHLDLSSNYLRSLKRSHFIQLSNLHYLYLQNNNLKVVEGMFDGLMNIQFLQVDSYTLCCAQPKAVNKIQCSAPVNEISSCYSLIDTPLLSVIIWYIALLAVFGNVLGMLYRCLVVKTKVIKSFDIYSTNLGFADLLMGVYLYIIAGANLAYNGRYGFEDDSWRRSPLCTFAGVLATLSSEASALFVLLITIDRIIIIRYPFSKLKMNDWIAKLISTLMWITSLFLAVLPLSESEYFDGYYSSSGICISLPISVLRKPGWEYSMILFVGANFFIFMAILLGQFVIFTDVLRMGREIKSQRSTLKGREINLAKTLIAVAVTDMLCWIPIGMIGKNEFLETVPNRDWEEG